MWSQFALQGDLLLCTQTLPPCFNAAVTWNALVQPLQVSYTTTQLSDPDISHGQSNKCFTESKHNKLASCYGCLNMYQFARVRPVAEDGYFAFRQVYICFTHKCDPQPARLIPHRIHLHVDGHMRDPLRGDNFYYVYYTLPYTTESSIPLVLATAYYSNIDEDTLYSMLHSTQPSLSTHMPQYTQHILG